MLPDRVSNRGPTSQVLYRLRYTARPPEPNKELLQHMSLGTVSSATTGRDRSLNSVNPIALKKAKTVYNFGLSVCNRVKSIFLHYALTSVPMHQALQL